MFDWRDTSYRDLLYGGAAALTLELATFYIPVHYVAGSSGWIPIPNLWNIGLILTLWKGVSLTLLLYYSEVFTGAYITGYTLVFFVATVIRMVIYLPPFESLVYLLALAIAFYIGFEG